MSEPAGELPWEIARLHFIITGPRAFKMRRGCDQLMTFQTCSSSSSSFQQSYLRHCIQTFKFMAERMCKFIIESTILENFCTNCKETSTYLAESKPDAIPRAFSQNNTAATVTHLNATLMACQAGK